MCMERPEPSWEITNQKAQVLTVPFRLAVLTLPGNEAPGSPSDQSHPRTESTNEVLASAEATNFPTQDNSLA